uniref:Poly(A) polymerase n=1 Tax=uncultured Alphaproteobacteria bacterium TaxID=91750 RepID=A0A6M4NMG2_9PROT|nr:poly(A) polymerase [uncultured Alphaproteobacteria bacterium]
MIRDKYLNINKITTDKSVLNIFDVVRHHGGSIRFVGGAVRDAIAGKTGFDLDLSTDLSPDELAEACEEANIKTVPIGLKYGTLGVVINNTLLEISSLRKDIMTDEGHVVEFTDDWKEDASRRDLTINAVYADEQGNVFDYYDGISDLEKGIVRFIGNADQRIKEDYLRILRFFRFHSLFAKTPVDGKALKACIDNRDGLKNLSIERIRDELIKIILTPNAATVMGTMLDNGILVNWLGNSDFLSNLEFLIKMETSCNIPPNPMRRLFVLYFPDKALAENIAVRMHMTKRQKDTMVKWAASNIGIENILEEKLRRKVIYRYGKEFCIDKLLIEAAKAQIVPDNLIGLIREIEEAVVPIFPISGRDIAKNGFDSGQIGILLDKLKERWIASDFSLSREELLALI